MREILEKLAALSEAAPSTANNKKNLTEASKWEEDTRGLDQPPAPIGEAGPPGDDLRKKYPDTKQGVLQFMQYGYDKSFLKKLDLPTCDIHPDPQVEGVWAVDSMASGFRCIIYLAGYRDPWGQIREMNDNEEGGFTMSMMKNMVEYEKLTPKLMKHWVKCGSLDPDDMDKLMKHYNYNFGESIEEGDVDESIVGAGLAAAAIGSAATNHQSQSAINAHAMKDKASAYVQQAPNGGRMPQLTVPRAKSSAFNVSASQSGARAYGSGASNSVGQIGGESVDSKGDQLNEYLVKEGGSIVSVLGLNVFCELYGDESLASYDEEIARSSAWKRVVHKYAPAAKRLEAEINANKDRLLTQEEADAVESVWYDGSDAYDTIGDAVRYLPGVYESQLEVIESILSGELGSSLDEALLSGPTQKYNEPDEDFDDGDPDSDNYCDNCGENFPMSYDSCPNCSELDEATNHLGEREFSSFNGWRTACRKFGSPVWFDGDRDICNAFMGSEPYVRGESYEIGYWDGAVGVVYNDEDVRGASGLAEDEISNLSPTSKTIPELLGKLARVIDSVQTLDQWRSAKKFSDIVFNQVTSRIKDREGFAGIGNSVATLRAIKHDLDAKRRSLSNDTMALEGASINNKWKVSYWVEEKSYTDAPARDYQESEIVTASSTTEAVDKIRNRPKDTGRMRYGFSVRPATASDLRDLDESVDDWKDPVSPVAQAITNRIMRQRVDLLGKYGPKAVTNAIDEVAEFVGDVEEIGSSDVSAWVKSVERALSSTQSIRGVEEGGYAQCESVINEKSSSEKQARTMAAAAHNPKFAKKVGIKQKVAKEFNKADTGTKQLSNAMKSKKKANESQVNELSPETHQSYQTKADLDIEKFQRAGNKEKMGKRAAGFARSLERLPMKQRTRLASLQTSEGKNMINRKNKINESVDFGNAPPDLVKILRHFGKEVQDFREGGELNDNLYDALYDYYFDDMPYGTKKARTGDPYEWISDRLDRDMSGPKFGEVTDKYMASQADHDIMGEKEYGNFDSIVSMPKEGAAGDAMPLEGVDNDINPFDDYDEWYDSNGRVSPTGAYDAAGHYFADRDADRLDALSNSRREEFMALGDSVGDSVELKPQPGEEIVTELQANDEERIISMLSNIGLDHGLDFWFEGNEIVVIGRTTARLVTNTVGGHIQSSDGEEFRIGAKPRAAKAPPADVNDLAAVPELMDGMFEGKMSELDIERKEKREKASILARQKKAKEKKEAEAKAKLKEDVSADDVEILTMQYKAGQLSYDEFREKLDSLEQTDYSMRQGEMGMQGGDTPAGNRAWDQESEDWDDNEYDEFEDDVDESALDPDNLDMTDLDFSDADKQDGLDLRGVSDYDFTGSRPQYDMGEGEFANSADEPARPEVHTSTTAMINQGNDLNRPKKQSYPLRNRGDNPMAEARSLMTQYQAMKATITK